MVDLISRLCQDPVNHPNRHPWDDHFRDLGYPPKFFKGQDALTNTSMGSKCAVKKKCLQKSGLQFRSSAECVYKHMSRSCVNFGVN